MVRSVAGISGGRTSALMAKGRVPGEFVPVDTLLTFQNTGFEHPATIQFLRELEQDIGRPIVALEYRAPARGRPPRESAFEVVPWTQLAMDGEPFLDMLECLRTFRDVEKGEGPVAPWAASRICTAHLKLKTRQRYASSLGMGTPRDYVDYVGLRVDEPERVARMKERNDKRDTDERAPLADAGITKADVLAFWRTQKYDLQIPEHLGNCVGCFMKDEADLASALVDDYGAKHAPILMQIERDYAPMRRGGRPSYAQVVAEAPARMEIRAALTRGDHPDTLAAAYVIDDGDEPPMEHPIAPRRAQLIIRQEVRAAAERSAWSCACDSAFDIADEED